MIDLQLLRSEPDAVIARIKKKDPAFDGQALVDLDVRRRDLLSQVETVRSSKNDLNDLVKKSGITPELKEQSISLSAQLKNYEQQLIEVEKEFKQLYLSCPNLPADDIPVGDKDANKVVSQKGEKPTYNFSIKNHVQLGQELGWFDFDAAAKMTGAQFVLYKGEAVKLMYALTMFMLKHNAKHGFEYVLPPYLANEKSLETASNFPKFRDQVYEVTDDQLFLIPTAEVSLTNLYRDTIFDPSQLPIRMNAWTSCFRREAGGYGAHERGLIRIHQFEKVELYTICQPEQSDAEQQRMLTCAQELLDQLGLHYRVSLLASQDCSFPSAKTYDIEVWMPGQNAYYEVSSVSNCTDFQARRGAMRYRKAGEKKTHMVHTLNGSSLALPRLMVALMETYQQADGTIQIPEIVKQYGIY